MESVRSQLNRRYSELQIGFRVASCSTGAFALQSDEAAPYWDYNV